VIDVSEHCGFSIKQQAALYNSIKPLFKSKPLIVALNKIDIIRPEQLSPEDTALLETLAAEGAQVIPMSTMSEEGIMAVKTAACDKLLAMRDEVKSKGKKINDVLNRLHLATPTARDDRVREVSIPESVLHARISGAKHLVDPEPEMDWENGLVPSVDWRKDYLLKNEDWKFDIIPEIMDGMNIADYVDPDILNMLEELEREEEERERTASEQMDDDDAPELTEEQMANVRAIREKRTMMVLNSRMKKSRNKPHATPLRTPTR
jgi:nucleolar GTP-binding protein